MVALSNAYSIAPGVWAVALTALPSLKLILPTGVSGRSDILITLVASDGTVLAEAKSVLAVASPLQQKSTSSAATSPSAVPKLRTETSPGPQRGLAPARAAGESMTSPDRERALRLMQKANEQLEDGNVSVARLFYEYAADAGLAEAAMALAGTFDASELAKLKVQGVAPDAKEAQRWYARARELGAADAEQRMNRLSAQ
jgi:hypothetical protein